MLKKIYVYARKIHYYIALPMLFFIVANVLSQGSPLNRFVFPVTVLSMASLAVTGGYMWFWLSFSRQKNGQGKK